MKIYNKLLVSLAVAFGIINILLASFGQVDLVVYFILDAIVYLVIALFYGNLIMRAQKSLNRLGAIIFLGFLFAFVLKMVEITQ